MFPEEKLLLELLLEKNPHDFTEKSIWCENSRYFFDGKAKPISSKTFEIADCEKLKNQIEKHNSKISYEIFNQFVQKFCEANKNRLNELISEAHEFIKETAKDYPEENIILSFSGGKDSSVVADIVTKALSNSSLVHIYGKEPYGNIIIKDLSDFGKELLEYRYDTPLYLYREVNTNSYRNALLNKERVIYV